MVNVAGKITENFTVEELANNKAQEVIKINLTPKLIEFIQMVQELRDVYGKPINVNSCYRTESYNRSVGGDKNSAHLEGVALDFKAHPEDYVKLTEWWRAICSSHNKIGGINYYTNGVHITNDEARFGNKSFTVRDYRGTKKDW